MTKATNFIKLKLFFAFIVLCLAPIVLVSLFNYYQMKSEITNYTLGHLEALIKIKSLQVDRFYSEINSELKTVSCLPAVINLLISGTSQQNLPLSDGETNKLATEVLRQFVINKDFDEMYIFGLDGKVLALYTDDTESSIPNNSAFENGKIKTYFSDIYLGHKNNKNYLFTASAPIKDYNGEIVGVLVAEVVADSFFKKMQDYSGLGSSGETLLGKKIGNEVIFLNPLRHDKNAALTRKAQINGKIARPVIDGASGKTGSGEAIDYRGESVVAAWGYISTTGWGIVAKIDANEALKPLIDARNNIIVTSLILLVFAIGASLKMAITFMRPIQFLEDSAHKDTLTGLPNRLLLMGLLEQVLYKAQLKNTVVATLFLDLDGFKAVNDSFGHEIGDLLLKSAAQRLTTSVRQNDTVARLGGDEFVIVLCGIQDTSNITKIANNVISSLNEEFSLNGHIVNIGVSIGISVFPNNAKNPDEMLKQADLAMYEAKKAGKNHFVLSKANA